MTGTEWLELNKDQLMEGCLVGRVSQRACKQRLEALKDPSRWKVAYQYLKCMRCMHSNINQDYAEVAEFKNWQLEVEKEEV